MYVQTHAYVPVYEHEYSKLFYQYFKGEIKTKLTVQARQTNYYQSISQASHQNPLFDKGKMHLI